MVPKLAVMMPEDKLKVSIYFCWLESKIAMASIMGGCASMLAQITTGQQRKGWKAASQNGFLVCSQNLKTGAIQQPIATKIYSSSFQA